MFKKSFTRLSAKIEFKIFSLIKLLFLKVFFSGIIWFPDLVGTTEIYLERGLSVGYIGLGGVLFY